MTLTVKIATSLCLGILLGSCLLQAEPSWAKPAPAQTMRTIAAGDIAFDDVETECNDSDGDGECDVNPPSE